MLRGFHVIRVSGADEAVVGDESHVHELLEFSRHLIHKLFGRKIGVLRGLGDLFAVLVRANREQDFFTIQTVNAGNDIRYRLLVDMTHVQFCIRVVNRARDEETLGHTLNLFKIS